MDALICPVCETPNAEDAVHCEVCGERLAPPAPGEDVPPEENVAAMIEEEPDFPESALEALSQPEDDEESPADPEAAGPRPMFLFSTVDGSAFPQGSPEYEDGFGPMGDQLVEELPDDFESEVHIDSEAMQDLSDATDAHEDPAQFDLTEHDTPTEEKTVDSQTPADETVDSLQQPSSPQFKAAFEVKPKQRETLEPLPQPGTLIDPARLTVYANREPVHTHFVETDETLIGRRDPRADAFPDLDLTDFDVDAHVSRKHAFIYRQNKNYTLYVVSNSGTQLNADLLDLGDRRTLADGDVIVLSGKIAMKFEIPQTG